MTGTLPYALLGAALSTFVGVDRLTVGSQTPNVSSTVAYLDVPEGHIIRLLGNTPFRMYLTAELTQTLQVGGSGDISVTVGADGRHMVRTARPATDFPNIAHPDVRAETSTDGGTTWAPATVNAVDWDAEVVTVARSGGNVNRVRVYYMPGDGEVEFRAVRPMGSDSGSSYLWGRSLRSVHETEQSNAEAALKIEGVDGKNLTPNYRFAVVVRAASKISLSTAARSELFLKVADVPVRVTDPSRLAALNEIELRGGNI